MPGNVLEMCELLIARLPTEPYDPGDKGTRALKRAGSSDLAVMQESGYYQRYKSKWRTIYWTVKEIIQRT